jgi:hypothetical protein
LSLTQPQLPHRRSLHKVRVGFEHES